MNYSITSLAIAAFLVLSLTNCGGENIENTQVPVEQTVTETFDQRAKHELEAKLQIPATEKYTYAVYREYINSDTVKDAIITINRLSFAIDEAIRSKKNTAKSAELGYMGNYNLFIYYDGASDKFSVPIPIPSTPGRPLDISFESILSPTRKDIVIGYRILNSGWKAYFSVLNESDLLLVFRWKLFDYAGTAKAEALYHSLEENTVGGVAKDIVIRESVLENNSVTGIGDIYKFEPVMNKKGKELYHFVYEPRAAKYRVK